MTEGTTLTAWTGSAAGPVVATDSKTVNSQAVVVQQVAPLFGDFGAFSGVQGGRLVDGSSSIGAGYVDQRVDGLEVVTTPTINTGAYTTGMSVGGILDFGALARAAGLGVLITSASLIDATQHDAPLDLIIFGRNPTNGTYTDHAVPTGTLTTDITWSRGVINFGTYANVASTVAICSAPNVGLHVLTANSQTHLYGLLLVRGSVTWGTTTALTVALSYIPD